VTRLHRFLIIISVAIVLATFGPPRSARANGIASMQFLLATQPWLICDYPPPPDVIFNQGIISEGTYTFATDAYLNGSLLFHAGASVEASLTFSAASSGDAGLVPGTGVAVGTTLLEQNVDVNFNIVDPTTPQGSVVLLAGELKGLLTIDTSTDTGTIALEPVPNPWTSDLVYAGIPSLIGFGTVFTLNQITTLSGGPLDITSGNITPFSSATGTGQFSTVPEPSSCVMAALGLGVVVTAGLSCCRSARPCSSESGSH
jgi:hypothetical protein